MYVPLNILSSVQVRFKNNIPLQCCKINCNLHLYCIGYCRIVITPTDAKLVSFVYIMYMCVKVVFCLLRS